MDETSQPTTQLQEATAATEAPPAEAKPEAKPESDPTHADIAASEPTPAHEWPDVRVGDDVHYCFEDRGDGKVRPAVVVEARAGGKCDLFVMFSPHDRLNGIGMEPTVLLDAPYYEDPAVGDDPHHRHWR